MDRQFEFTHAVNHVRKQGRPATDGGNGCMYRSRDGGACIIGARIPDALYEKRMEWQMVGALLDHFPPLRSVFGFPSDPDVNFLRELQQMHDHSVRRAGGDAGAFMSDFEFSVAAFAKLHDLEVPA